MKRFYLSILFAASLFTVKAQSTFTITINPTTTYQTVSDFGASDCWTADYVGKYFSNTQKSQAAKWLFSQGFDTNGNPEGIGLSVWRVNIGAGSADPNSESNIKDETRRTECFLSKDGSYNWDKSSGQQYFMQQAKQYGVDNFLLFSNSAPVYYTANGLANNKDNASGANLKADCYDDFAEFLANVTVHFNESGYNIKYIDPVNEPAFNWTEGQEGSPWQNNEISKLVRELDKSLSSRNLPTQIIMPEASSLDRLYQTSSDNNGRASNQIEAFWNKTNTDTYIGDLSHVAKAVAGHDYWTFTTNDALTTTRKNVAAAAAKYGLNVMQTEWSMLDAAPKVETGFPDSYDTATDMDIALFMGKLIHIGMTQGNYISWSYWTAMSQSMYGQRNRFELMRLNATGDENTYESYKDLKTGGTVSATPNLWVLGNYSRFVRPGYKRIALTGDGDINSLMGSAYLSPDGKKVVAVFVNMNTVTKGVKLAADDFSKTISSVKKYTTDATNNLTCDETITDVTTRIMVPARSVVTFTFDLNATTGITNVKSDSTKADNGIYNLNGQKVADSADKYNSLEHGVYIINGKKLIKK